MFTHRYFSIAQQTPFKFANEKVPRRIVICDKITNWVFLAFNSITPILFGVGMVAYLPLTVICNQNPDSYCIKSSKVVFSSYISYATALLLSINSGFVLFYALYKIKQSLKT